MNKVPVFSGKKIDGVIVWDRPDRIAEWKDKLPEGFVEMTLQRSKPTRSRGQRGYYFGYLCKELMAPLGLDNVDEVNQWLKDHFNARTVKVFGREEKLGMSIEHEKRDRVEEIYRDIREKFATVGIYLREPNQNDWLNMYN